MIYCMIFIFLLTRFNLEETLIFTGVTFLLQALNLEYILTTNISHCFSICILFTVSDKIEQFSQSKLWSFRKEQKAHCV